MNYKWAVNLPFGMDYVFPSSYSKMDLKGDLTEVVILFSRHVLTPTWEVFPWFHIVIARV